MKTIMKFIKSFAVLAIIVGLLWIVLSNYSVIFSKSVNGEVTAIEKVEIPVALMARAESNINAQVFSFAIGIKDIKSGEIFTAFSDQRQWAVVEKGQCAEAEFLPYPPWELT